MTVEEMAKHIARVCKIEDIEISYLRKSGGRAWRKRRIVKTMPIKSEVTYALALHEIGHVLGENPKHRLDREVAAWVWAQENSIEWTERMENYMKKGLRSYVAWAERSRRAKKPEPDHLIFEMTR